MTSLPLLGIVSVVPNVANVSPQKAAQLLSEISHPPVVVEWCGEQALSISDQRRGEKLDNYLKRVAEANNRAVVRTDQYLVLRGAVVGVKRSLDPGGLSQNYFNGSQLAVRFCF